MCFGIKHTTVYFRKNKSVYVTKNNLLLSFISHEGQNIVYLEWLSESRPRMLIHNLVLTKGIYFSMEKDIVQ